MDRIVRDRTPNRRTEEVRTLYFSEFSDRPNIVLLGDPGAGKSHLFDTFAKVEGGRVVTVRAFLDAPVFAKGEVLFIDGLDEKRAGRGDRDTVGALVGKLFEAAPTKVRLSCRVADWLGESDLASLQPFFEKNGGEPTVLGLERLSAAEREAVLVAKGGDAPAARAFLNEAEARGLDEFLGNPQNLLMLHKAVQSGRWPESRTEVYELSTELLLQEADTHHSLKPTGIYSAAELRPVAGALFAARLISDVEAIGISDQEGSKAAPSYRSLSIYSRDLTRAALTRRVFKAGDAPQSAEYAHRTTAEYLGAEWLAGAVRDGLPFARLQALLGVDGHPAPELRGLHAWLAVHLPEHAEALIDADPYGVLTYGDAAALSRAHRMRLLKALGDLSESDPWFRHDERDTPAVGALARPDMIDAFRSVMHSPEAGFGVRLIVVEALSSGAVQPALIGDLARIVARDASFYAERYQAVQALLRFGAAGRDALRDAYRNKLGKRADEIRLRVDILRAIYNDGFSAPDIVALMNDLGTSPEDLPGGVLWFLADALPAADLPEILDGISFRKSETKIERRNAWDIASFYERILVRAWNELPAADPARALTWLRTRRAFSRLHGSGHEALLAAFDTHRDRLLTLADCLFKTLPVNERDWYEIHRFEEMTMHRLSGDDLLSVVLGQLSGADARSVRQRVLYEAAFTFLGRRSTQGDPAVFTQLWELGEGDAGLKEIRDAHSVANLPERYLERKLGIDEDEQEAAQSRAEHRRRFEEDVAKIRSGDHLGWLGFLAQIYLGMFTDVEDFDEPRARLAFIIGEPNVDAAIEGLRAVLQRPNLPRLAQVAVPRDKREYFSWWYAPRIAIDLLYGTEGTLDAIPDDVLKAQLAYDLVMPVFNKEDSSIIVPAWKDAALQEKPALVHDAYLTVARAQLGAGDQHVDGLRELMNSDALAPWRAETALALLCDFPNANFFRLDELLDAVVAMPEAHAAFVGLASDVLAGTTEIDAQQRDRWLAAAYLLAPTTFEAALVATARDRPGIIFDVRDLAGSKRFGGPKQTVTLTSTQLEFMARLTGAHHPNTGHPKDGWSGDTNAWDASDYVGSLVNRIAADPSETATQALVRLASDPALASYRALLRHAKAQQESRRRAAAYDRPEWKRTIAALKKGAPATVADLHALLVEQLRGIRDGLARTNTDPFKKFWNLDRHARPKTPKPEEPCRDTLVDMMRVVLGPVGIMIEPEGHMAHDKRADISVAMPKRKVLCELKRDYHPDVWSAADTQLERFYAHDPDAQGFGVYVVLWFGGKRGKAIPKAPRGQKPPRSAADMQRMLEALMPEGRRHRIAIRVIDVSGRLAPAKQTRAKTGRKKRKTGRLPVRRPTKIPTKKTKRKQIVARVKRSAKRMVVSRKRQATPPRPRRNVKRMRSARKRR